MLIQKILRILLLFPLFSFTLIDPVDLTIEISQLKNNKGQILLELNDSEKNLIKGISEEIKNNRCTITIHDLMPGKYAFKYFHDENSNKKIDTNWVGIPKEGYGFSNGAKGAFGPPSHRKLIFELTTDTTVVCNPLYLKK